MRVPVFVSRSFPTPTGLSPLGESRRISLFPRYEDLVASCLGVPLVSGYLCTGIDLCPGCLGIQRSPGMGPMNTGNGGAPFHFNGIRDKGAFYFFNFFTFSFFTLLLITYYPLLYILHLVFYFLIIYK